MFCQSCLQETEEGKFCTSCGAELTSDEKAVTIEPSIDSTINPEPSASPVPVVAEQAEEPNEFVEKVKDASSHFGEFFLTLVKKPSTAKAINKSHLTSAIITIGIFSLLIALNTYFTVQTTYGEIFGSSASFSDDLLLPFIRYIILFGLIAAITFAATKIAMQEVSFIDVIAKYGAYLMPFVLLYVVGILFSVISLGFPFTVATTISLSGPILVIPVLILIEQPIKKFDKVYIILGLILASQLISSSLSRIGSSWFN